MSIESVPAASPAYVPAQATPTQATSEPALVSRPDVKDSDSAAVAKAATKTQVDHHETSQSQQAQPGYIQVNEVHLLPTPQPLPLTGRLGHGRIDVYV